MKKYDNLRINIFFGVVLLVSGLILYRLFILSYVKHSFYSLTSETQNENISNILARGNIYLKEGDGLYLAATNKKTPLAYIAPSYFEKGAGLTNSAQAELIYRLIEILGIDKASIEKALETKSSSFKVLKRDLNNEQVEKIKNLKIKGAGVSYETDRFYAGGSLASNVLGFVGYGENGRSGQYGVESFYDKELSGRQEAATDYTDPKRIAGIFSAVKNYFLKKIGRGQESGDRQQISEVNQGRLSDSVQGRPADLVLTVDKNIQEFIEDKLNELMKKWEAASATVIVQEPNSGKILAMADRPSFNPNDYGGFKTDLFLNRSVQDIFEPGSSYKPITMAMGLDLGKVSPATTFTDTGSITVAGRTIRNFSEKVFGVRTMSEVLEKSINTGAMFVENLIGDENFLNYSINFGFGQRTGIDLPGELSGDITNLYSGRKINYLTASFGQGIAVTPIQMINSFSAIANGGKLMKPFVVEKIIRGGDEIITKSEIVGIPFSEKTSGKLKAMLVSVVDNGFDKARIKGYDIAGKTGTAQIPDKSGGYAENEFIHDFLGFAPAYNPKFVVLIKMDRPKGITFAADSLSPTFREITVFLLNYYKIPPTRQ